MRPRASLTVALAAGITAGGLWWLAILSTTTPIVALAAGAQVESAPTRSFELSIRQRALVGGATTLRVVQGEQVQLRLVSDEPMTLHLHGYDIETTISPERPARIRFQATSTGRFPLAAHLFGPSRALAGAHREKVLLYLEVHPR